MKTSLGKIIAASIGFAGVVFLIMAAGSIHSIRQTITEADSMAHTEEVEARLNGVLALALGWESGTRGYVITGDPAYLAPYANAKAELEARLAELDNLVADNPTQVANVAGLSALVERKIAFLQNIRAQRDQAGLAATTALLAANDGRQLMDEIRARISTMRGVEDNLLAQRREDSTRQTALSIAAAVATSAVGLAVLAVAALVIARQFQARLRAQQELSLKQAELQSIIDNSPSGIFLKDRAGRYLVLNRPMRALLGRDPSECLGKRPAELFPSDRAALIETEDAAVCQALAATEIDYETTAGDGSHRIFRTTKFPLRNAAGEIYAIGGISTDITEQRRMEGELRRALTAAESASRTKSQFLANMSHELRTPLNSIIGFSEILSDRLFGALNEKQQHYVGNILTSGRHLLLLINDLLDLAKIEAGKMHLEPDRLAVAALLNDGANLVRGSAERKGVALSISPLDAALTVRVDPARAKQIIYNLLSNAVKFTPAGGRVTLTAEKVVNPSCPPWGGPRSWIPGGRLAGEWLRLAVADTGIGIAAGDLRRIFAEFEQADSSYAREQEGTGLGLALTTKLAAMHGGAVWAESPGRVNQGSTFHVLLPIDGPPEAVEEDADAMPPAMLPSATTPTPTPFAAAPSGKNGRATVLVVEDDLAASHLMREYLSSGGYEVVLATTGEEALRLAAQVRPAAITLDVVLPDANGMDVLARLKATRATRNIPVIVVSVTDDRQVGLSLGAAEFFVKPVNSEKLLAALDRVSAITRRPIQRVLIVDDEATARESVVSLLEPRGYRVQAAASGEEALRCITERPPDVAIIDLTMPGMSGFELVALLRQSPATRQLPICIYTAKDLSASEMHWLHEQSTAVAAKPFREQLLSEVQRACATSAA